MHRRAIARIRLASIVTSAAALIIGCSPRRTPEAVRVSVGPRATMAPVYLAAEKQFFRDEGIDISLQEIRSPLEALTLISGDSIDAALFSFIPALPNAVPRGARIRLVAGRDASRPGCADEAALYYRTTRFPNGLSESANWKGATIAQSSPNAAAEFDVDLLLSIMHVSPGEVKVPRMSPEDAWAGAAAGKVDVFLGSGRPNLLQSGLPAGVARSEVLEHALGDFQYSYVVFGRRLLDGDPSIGTAFMKAYLRGVRAFVAGESPAFFNDFARRFQLDLDELKKECRNNIELNGELRLRDLQRWMTWAEQKGYLTPGLKAEQIVERRFQEAALRSIGTAR